MDEIELQKQRLLDDDGLPPAATSTSPRQHLDLNEPRPAGKPKRSSLTPARFCIGLCSVVALVVCGAIVYGLYSLLQTFSDPHGETHANATLSALPERESELVRPLFGPATSGGRLQSFDLGLVVRAQWATLNTDKLDEDAEYSAVPDGSAAALGIWNQDSREVHRSVILSDVALDTPALQTNVQVTLSRDIISGLINPHGSSELVASFVMLPPASDASPLLQPLSSETLNRTSVTSTTLRNWTAWHAPAAWLAFNETDDASAGSPLTEFLSRAAVHEDLLHSPGLANQTDDFSRRFGVLTRSWVTSARDYPVYNRTRFAAQMTHQREYLRGACAGGRDRSSPACLRQFLITGHFEHLLQTDGPLGDSAGAAEDPRFWYAPFLDTDLVTPSKMDFAQLPAFNATDDSLLDDFTFDYRVSFSTSSLKRLAMLSGPYKAVRVEMSKAMPDRINATAHDLASSHDSAEFWNALSGHHFEPGSRPLVRGALETVAGVLSFAHTPIVLYFWMTRSLTTGISMPAWTFDATLDLVLSLVYGTRFLRNGQPLWLFALIFGLDLLQFTAIANLALRLEWAWGGPLGWVPVGVARRRPTHSERASARADAQFVWRDRAVVFAVCFLARAYAPALPHLITASPPKAEASDTDVTFRVTAASSLLGRTLIPLLVPFQRALWTTLLVSQWQLNRTRRSFGQSKLVVWLLLAQGALERLPIVLHAVVGRPQLMQALTVGGTVQFALLGALAYQAAVYPAVPQEEEEDE